MFADRLSASCLLVPLTSGFKALLACTRVLQMGATLPQIDGYVSPTHSRVAEWPRRRRFGSWAGLVETKTIGVAPTLCALLLTPELPSGQSMASFLWLW